jgi:hypothetical protein
VKNCFLWWKKKLVYFYPFACFSLMTWLDECGVQLWGSLGVG